MAPWHRRNEFFPDGHLATQSSGEPKEGSLKTSVLNATTPSDGPMVSDEVIVGVVRAVNRQIEEDFAPYWQVRGELRDEGSVGTLPPDAKADARRDLRGDAVIYLTDDGAGKSALGFHDMDGRDIPFGVVDIAIAIAAGRKWSVTLSHETLELLADPEVNRLAIGPHPDPGETRRVYRWYEICDPVQAESCSLDGIHSS